MTFSQNLTIQILYLTILTCFSEMQEMKSELSDKKLPLFILCFHRYQDFYSVTLLDGHFLGLNGRFCDIC